MKPFDLEAAKRGEPICTRDGVPAKFIAHIPENQEFNRVAFSTIGAVHACSEAGVFSINDPDTCLNLFMAPKPKVKREGWVNIYRRADWTFTGEIHATESEAIDVSEEDRERIDTIRIEWEEEA